MEVLSKYALRFAVALVVSVSVLAPASALHAQASGDFADPSGAWVRTILHKAGGRTESKQDSTTQVLEEKTYDKRNVLVKRNIFQLSEAGSPIQGLVFDGNQNLIARIAYGFDRFGRVQEERVFSPANLVVRRLFYRYAPDGTKLPPIGFSYGDGSGAEERIDPSLIAPSILTPGVEGARPLEGSEVIEGTVGGGNGGVVPSTSIYGPGR